MACSAALKGPLRIRIEDGNATAVSLTPNKRLQLRNDLGIYSRLFATDVRTQANNLSLSPLSFSLYATHERGRKRFVPVDVSADGTAHRL